MVSDQESSSMYVDSLNVLRSNTQISCNCYKSLKYISYCMLYYIMTLVSSQFCLFIALCIQKTDKHRSRLSIKTKAMTSKYIPLIPQVAEGLVAVAFAAGSEPLLKREGTFVYRKEGTPVGAKTLYRAKTIYHDTFPINFLNTYNCHNNQIFLQFFGGGDGGRGGLFQHVKSTYSDRKILHLPGFQVSYGVLGHRLSKYSGSGVYSMNKTGGRREKSYLGKIWRVNLVAAQPLLKPIF